MARSSTTFKKGQVTNPKGRPKEVAHVRALAREKTEDAIETLHEIMMNRKEPGSARVAAARELLDRGYGRAPQQVDVDLKKTVTVVEMSEAELAHVATTGELPDGVALQ
ncbi:MAG: DUF5681 domain-containing protein [Myxococcota bacterium]